MGLLSNIAKAIEGGRLDARREREQEDRRLQETVSSIQQLNTQEDEAWRRSQQAAMRGCKEEAEYYKKQAERLSDAAFGLSGSTWKNRK